MSINDYDTDNKMANEPTITTVLDECYGWYFTNVSNIQRPKDKERQEAGIDVIINFSDGKTPIFLDEKIRRYDYGDILLEEYSDWDRKIPGWLMADSKRTHFIAFVWLDSRKILLIPYGPLRYAFFKNRAKWEQNHLRIFAENKDYYTSSFKVPKQELFDAFWRSSWITFEPDIMGVDKYGYTKLQ